MNNPIHSRGTVALAVGGAIVCGALVALQTRINGQLGLELGDGYLAAFISFGSGFLLMAIIAAVQPGTRRGIGSVIRSIRAGTTPWWYAAGGVAGAIFVLSQGLTAALLGVALFTVATVTGQTVSGLIVDRRGLGTMRPHPLTASRLIGAVLAVLAVAFSVAPQLKGGVAPWVLILPLVAGLGLGVQQAVNGQIREIARSPLAATFFNFAVGATVLGVILLVHAAVTGLPGHLSSTPYLYLGGAVGIIFVAGYALVVRFTGVLVMGLAAIAGQLVASLIFDIVLPVPGHVLAWTTVVGVVGTLLAVAVAARPRRAPVSRGATGVSRA